jgi:tRNA (guanine37-N1)-methyltransferase
MVPGVLAESASFEEESHYSGLLEFPQYTRPEVWHDMPVPEVLLSGHHGNVEKWRRKQSLELTRDRRPDLFEKIELSKQDKKLLESDDLK